MKAILKNQKLKILLILLLFVVLLFSSYSPFPEFTKTADAIESVSTNSDTKILSGKEKNSYIKLTEKSKVFKEVSGNSKLDKSTLVQEVTTQNNAFYSTLVIISGLKKHNKLTEYQVYIDPETNTVVRVITANFSGEESSDTFSYSDYDETGTLRVVANGTLEEAANGEINFIDKKPVNDGHFMQKAVSDKYIYWACRFSGFLACQTASLACGPAKFLCSAACSYAFKKAACDRYK